MATWKRYVIEASQQDTPDLDNALAAVQAVADGAQGIVNALADAEGFLAGDPVGTALGVIVEAYSNLVDDLAGTDVYALPMLPHSWEDLLHPYTITNAIDDVVASLSDQLDPNRPLFHEAGGAFASLTILVGADNWMDFRRLIKLLSEMFSEEQLGKWARFADLRLQFDKFTRHPVPRPDRNSQGATWDWYRTNWMDWVPTLGRALQALRDAMDSMVGYPVGALQGLRDLLEVLNERLDYIRQVLQEIAHLIAFIARIKELIPSASFLWLQSESGGSAEYLRQLSSAGNAPKFKLCGGITLVAATGNPVAYFNSVKQLLGFQLVEAESAYGRAIFDAQNGVAR